MVLLFFGADRLALFALIFGESLPVTRQEQQARALQSSSRQPRRSFQSSLSALGSSFFFSVLPTETSSRVSERPSVLCFEYEPFVPIDNQHPVLFYVIHPLILPVCSDTVWAFESLRGLTNVASCKQKAVELNVEAVTEGRIDDT